MGLAIGLLFIFGCKQGLVGWRLLSTINCNNGPNGLFLCREEIWKSELSSAPLPQENGLEHQGADLISCLCPNDCLPPFLTLGYILVTFK